MKKLFLVGLSGLMLLSLTTCYEKPDFPTVPSIRYASISKETIVDPLTTGLTDIVTIGIEFQDGDGDLGLSDTDPPTDDTDDLYYNYFVTAFIQEGDDFVPIADPTALGNRGRFTRLTENNQAGPIEGTLNREIEYPYLNPLPVPPNSLVRFEVQIRDRALNLSNVVVTDTIRIFTE